VVKDFRTLARLGHVSPARISQIVSLLHLAPNIQEALLFRSRPEGGQDCLGLCVAFARRACQANAG
jgi:hypothetical protein